MDLVVQTKAKSDKPVTECYPMDAVARDVNFGIQIGPDWPQMGVPKCTETDLKKSQICPIWRQSNPIWMSNLTSLIQTHVYCHELFSGGYIVSKLHHTTNGNGKRDILLAFFLQVKLCI